MPQKTEKTQRTEPFVQRCVDCGAVLTGRTKHERVPTWLCASCYRRSLPY